MIKRWSEGVADHNMAEDILVDLAALVDRHPWWRARARLAKKLLGRLGITPPARVLDVGCGWGTTLQALELAGYRVTGADISKRALERLDRPGRELVEVDVTKPLPTDEHAGYDAVLALDVIEHLDDDRAAVGRLCELARAGGYVVVSVPARPDLFSEFDEIQGHRRRYLPATLENAFQVANLELVQIFWWGAWMVPLVRRSRRRSQAVPRESTAQAYCHYLQLPPWPIPLAMTAAYALEQPLALAGNLHNGTSLFAVARRRE
jgi:2-polyprenyl-3-methyl-5-hydroxy-6-metoxy-1,4-benzoquinol methylase